MGTFIIFIIVLTLVVLVHEAGHFFVARMSGMKVYEFGWGFPPRLWGWYRDPKTKKIHWVKKNKLRDIAETGGGIPYQEEFPATLYSINLLPLGGFVKIKGENGDADGADSFGAGSFLQKIGTLLAGVVMNFLLAVFLLGFGFMIGLPTDFATLTDARAIIVKPAEVQIQHIEKNSPAARAGLQPGDVVLSANDTQIKNASSLVSFVQSNGEQNIRLHIQRNETTFVADIKPQKIQNDAAPRMGVSLADAGIVRFPWYSAFYKGLVAAALGFLNVFVSFFILIKGLVLGNGLLFGVSGPVGIAVAVGESARMGFNYLLNVTAMISLSLAALNVLPIPALDGGRALFVIIEKITKRKVSVRTEQIIHTIGFVALLAMILFITFKDIKNLL